MSVLVIIDQPAYGSWSGREALDMALALAAFDQPASLLFSGAGINWLRKRQSPQGIDQKGVDRNLAAAPVFGIEEILADRSSLTRYGLSPEHLLDGSTVVDCTPDFLNNYHHVVCL